MFVLFNFGREKEEYFLYCSDFWRQKENIFILFSFEREENYFCIVQLWKREGEYFHPALEVRRYIFFSTDLERSNYLQALQNTLTKQIWNVSSRKWIFVHLTNIFNPNLTSAVKQNNDRDYLMVLIVNVIIIVIIRWPCFLWVQFQYDNNINNNNDKYDVSVTDPYRLLLGVMGRTTLLIFQKQQAD